MAMKQKINPLTWNFDMVSDGDSWTIKQKFNPLTWNFDMVGEWEVKMKLNPLTSNFDMVSEWEPWPTPPTETVNITIRTSDDSKWLIENDLWQTATEYYAEVPVWSQINYDDPVLYLSSWHYSVVRNRWYYFSNWYPAPSIATEDITINAYWQNAMEVNSNIFTEIACPFEFQWEWSITVNWNFEWVQIVSPNGSGDPNVPDSCLVISVNGTTRPQQYDSDANAFVCWIYNTVMDTDIEISLNWHWDTTFDITYKWAGSNEINDQWTLQEPQQPHSIYVEVNDTDYEPSEITLIIPDDLPTNTQSFNNMLVKDTDFNFFNVYVPNVWDSNNPIPWLIVSVAWSYISWTYDSDYDAFIVSCWAISASQDDITIEVTPELDHDLTFTVEFSFDWIAIYWDTWALYL